MTIAPRYNLIPVVAPAAVKPVTGVPLGPFDAIYQSAKLLFDMRTLVQLVDRFRAREEV